MKIRRYLGRNNQEAILKVKMDLGSEAVILNTRKVRQKGLFKLFAKPMVEVLAAIDDENGGSREKPFQRQAENQRQAPVDAQSRTGRDDKDQKLSELEKKVSSLESLLQKVYDQLQPAAQKEDVPVRDESKETADKIIELFYNNLVRNDVDAEIARKIADMASEKLKAGAGMNDVASAMYAVVAGMLGKPDTIAAREDGKPAVVIFVGPTGVGKTTTLAKIAANYTLNYKKNVGLITADTYRIAAVEQLKTYAEILGIPVQVVYSPGEIGDAIKMNSDKDVILIDTAGRSYRNRNQFEELKSLVLASEADEVYLVLSATISLKSCREIINNYNFLDNYKLIFTKLDETPIYGIILNARYLTGKSLSYITNGQNVPDDIEIANTDKLTKSVLGSVSP